MYMYMHLFSIHKTLQSRLLLKRKSYPLRPYDGKIGNRMCPDQLRCSPSDWLRPDTLYLRLDENNNERIACDTLRFQTKSFLKIPKN